MPGRSGERRVSGARVALALLSALALLLGWSEAARAADEGECLRLREQREALATAAMEQEIALARTIRDRLCPQLARRAEGANARDGLYTPIDYGAWSRCRREAERRLEASHSQRYRNLQGFTFYTPEGATLAREADQVMAALKDGQCL